jgi:Zn-dependent protease with chaperone function
MAAQSRPLTLPEVQSAFTGNISPARLSSLYRVGLAVVAGTMVLLPLCYIGLIALWGWLIKWHLAENVWLLSGRSARVWRGIAYVGPAVAGIIMFFFLVKPLFARAPRREDPVRLDPDQEPVLFAFIDRICDGVRAPRPSRVVVDCQVNASASFERGFLGLLRRRLVLTIGLPLTAGLSARQLGGVLAHEFGHFAQGAGMGLTFVIRSVNGWFARVVYQRDEWDDRLERWSRGTDWRLAIVLWLARAGVWTSRKILHGLMLAGNVVSCFMSRQMEFDADYYEAALAGSTTFRETMQRLDVLSRASQYGYGDVMRSRRTGRVPSNFPALVVARAEPLTPRSDTDSGQEEHRRAKMFMTHPSDEDRVAQSARLAAAGILTLEGPADRLFSNFGALAGNVTRHHYSADLGLDVDQLQLLDPADLLGEVQAADAEDRALRRFFGGVLLGSRPIGPAGVEALGVVDGTARLAVLRTEIRAALARAREAAGNYREAEERWTNAADALALLQSGLRIHGPDFDLVKGTVEHARAAMAEAEDVKTRLSPVLDHLEELQAKRLAIATSLAGHTHPIDPDRTLPGSRADILRFSRALAVMRELWPLVLEAQRQFVTWKQFLINREAAQESAAFAQEDRLVMQALRTTLTKLAAHVQQEPYPFAHAQEGCSIAAYLRGNGPPPDSASDESLYEAAHGHLDRALALYYSALGRLAAIALEIEDAVLPEQAATA